MDRFLLLSDAKGFSLGPSRYLNIPELEIPISRFYSSPKVTNTEQASMLFTHKLMMMPMVSAALVTRFHPPIPPPDQFRLFVPALAHFPLFSWVCDDVPSILWHQHLVVLSRSERRDWLPNKQNGIPYPD